MSALDALTESWFTPKSEEGEFSAEFKIRGLTGLEAIDLIPLIRIFTDDNGETQVHMGTDAVKILLVNGLKDWRNYVDSDDNELKFAQKNISRMSLFTCKELATEIFTRTQISADDKKKS